MTKTQTVKELLSRFNLELDLSSQCLSLEFKSNITPSNIQNASDFYNNVKVSKDYDAAEHIRDSQFNIINQVKSWLKNIL